MALKLYNTLSRKKEEFAPLKKGEVRMYTCGPTVYNYAHIGNFRAYVVADVLRRYLMYKGLKVRQVMNLTDVDDKTIKGAMQEGISLDKYTEKYKKAFFGDIEKMNVMKADFYPEATKTIPEIVALVKKFDEIMKPNLFDESKTAKVVEGLDLDGDGNIDDVEIKE